MRLLRIIHTFTNDEGGSSLTEFVMFLPIFITVFAGLMHLSVMNMANTQVQLNAQQKMWDEAIEIASSGLDNEHVSSTLGSGAAAVELETLAFNDSNPQQLADGAEGVIMAGGALGGHWGEAYGRVAPFEAISIADKEPELDPSEILNDRPFPTKMMNDGLYRDTPSSIVGAIMDVVSATGLIHAQGAGIRYGVAFGEDSQDVTVGHLGDYHVEAHYDVLVPPSPRKTGLEHKGTIILAWLMSQDEDNYANLLVFGGDPHLESENSSDSLGLQGQAAGAVDESDSELDSKDDEVGDAEDELEEQQNEEGGG